MIKRKAWQGFLADLHAGMTDEKMLEAVAKKKKKTLEKHEKGQR